MRESRFRILILGGYGHFGERIARSLADHGDLALIIGGRSGARAAALCEQLSHQRKATVEGISIDCRAEQFRYELGRLTVDLVIHTGGPFQAQGYEVAKACLATGTHYVDLADGRQFVTGIRRFDEEAQQKGLLLVSGASTVPGVSSVVVDAYAREFARINSIEIVIAPANQTPRGLATVTAVLSYCGKPFSRWDGMQWQCVYGWQDMKRMWHPDLGRRWMAACDVPDLELFPNHYTGRPAVAFYAALELGVLQWGLWLAGWVARARLIRTWSRCAAPLKVATDRLLSFGSDNGGMSVRMSGLGHDGRKRTVHWFLLARRNHGPEIPCIPALVLAQKLASGSLPVRGAMPCVSLFRLEDFAAAAAHLDISWHDEWS